MGEVVDLFSKETVQTHRAGIERGLALAGAIGLAVVTFTIGHEKGVHDERKGQTIVVPKSCFAPDKKGSFDLNLQKNDGDILLTVNGQAIDQHSISDTLSKSGPGFELFC